jgi:SAM-dependent methyltransferase
MTAQYHCPSCRTSYPLTPDGVPILIDEDRSVFSAAQLAAADPFFTASSRIGRIVERIVPKLGRNRAAAQNFAALRRLILDESPEVVRVLVLGGSILGEGMKELFDDRVELVETDISIGPRTQIVSDATSIPFDDGSFDAVVAQALLEHVTDPFLVVDEIHRVLKRRGYVYAEVPFMQQVHGGAYDFHRFTHLGLLRLFRRFTEVSSGAVAGAGTALAWAYSYFLASFVGAGRLRTAAMMFARMTAAPLKYFDPLFSKTSSNLDAASGLYFLGRRAETAIGDRELLQQYRGSKAPVR